MPRKTGVPKERLEMLEGREETLVEKRSERMRVSGLTVSCSLQVSVLYRTQMLSVFVISVS